MSRQGLAVLSLGLFACFQVDLGTHSTAKP